MKQKLKNEIRRLKVQLKAAKEPIKILDIYGMIKLLESMLEDLN
jgi:hypothetical protein